MSTHYLWSGWSLSFLKTTVDSKNGWLCLKPRKVNYHNGDIYATLSLSTRVLLLMREDQVRSSASLMNEHKGSETWASLHLLLFCPPPPQQHTAKPIVIQTPFPSQILQLRPGAPIKSNKTL